MNFCPEIGCYSEKVGCEPSNRRRRRMDGTRRGRRKQRKWRHSSQETASNKGTVPSP